MKLRFFDRLLIAVGCVCLLLISLFSLVLFFGLLKMDGMIGAFIEALPLWGRIGLIVLSLLIGAISVYGLMALFLPREERKYVSQENENGNVSISIKALETMVRKCIDNCKDVRTKHVGVYRKGEGVAVDVSVLVPSGISIPQLIGNLQRQIRKYVSSCSGIPVETISVQVETDPSQKGYVPALLAPKLAEDEAVVIESEPMEAVSAEAQDQEAAFDKAVSSEGSEPDSSDINMELNEDVSQSKEEDIVD